MLKLDIGYGGVPLKKGWLGVDPYIKDPNVKAFAWDLPYKDLEVNEIYSSHTLEHISKLKIVPTLNEWHRVLVPNGKLTILVPDFAWCCQWWLDHQTNGWDMDIIFGNQGRKGEFHYTGFNREIMIDYLTKAGFKVKKFEKIDTHQQKTLSFECIKQ